MTQENNTSRKLFLSGQHTCINKDSTVLIIPSDGDPVAVTGLTARVLQQILVNPQTGWTPSSGEWKVAEELTRAGVLSSGPITPPERCVVAMEGSVPELAAALAMSGVDIHQRATICLAVTHDYLDDSLAQTCTRWEKWLPLRPFGNKIWIGPLMARDGAVCWECVRHWLRMRRWRQAVHLGLDSGLPAPARLARQEAWGIAAGMASSLVRQGEPTRAILRFDLDSLTTEESPVIGRMDCPACGQKAASEPPGRRFAAWQSPLTGILDHLSTASAPGGQYHLALGSVCLPLAVAGKREGLRPVSVGARGRSVEEAKARCVMEAWERYSITFAGNEPLREAAPGETCIGPPDLLLISRDQYRKNHELRFCDAGRVKWWVEAAELGGPASALIPAGCAYLWYPFTEEPYYCAADSNGCAAGQTIEQARLSAILELVERDALGIWWYNRIRRPAIAWQQWNDPELHSIDSLFRRQGNELHLVDITNDLGIPATVALTHDREGRQIYFGAAADLCPRQSARRAASELLSFWYWGTQGRVTEARKEWLRIGTLATHSYLKPAGQLDAREPVSLQPAAALDQLSATIHRAGMRIWNVDMTRPESGIPVARVFIPGLRHYRPHAAPGRLYDVPVKLGWLAKPLPERDLNPDSCVL